MLSRIVKRNCRIALRSTRLPSIASTGVIARFQSISSQPKEVFTKLSDTSDPQRSQFFQYTWGSWLQDDKIKKRQRETVFSIEGISTLLEELNKNRSDEVVAPKPIDGSVVLAHNLDLLGKLGQGTSKLLIKSIASVYEGKHHRIYKISLSTGKELALRIPYKLDSEFAISNKIKSEVATLDFLNLKLNLNVAKVLAFGDSKLNQLETPFILEEFIPGNLLMKDWNPLLPDSEETTAHLKEVIDPIADFNDKLLSITFNKYGSLYFYNDVEGKLKADLPYDGETDSTLVNRWRIGPSVERPFTKNKEKLTPAQISQFNGPWTNPQDLITSVGAIELENAKTRLSLVQADAGEVTSKELLTQQIKTFEHFNQISDKLFNTNSKSIMNVEELFKPRLFVPDLDPLNVIVTNDKQYYFVDFEGSTIKPFILTSYPNFVGYQGAKVFDLEQDIPGYNKMDEVEKQQYEFMYYKTRNERLWEVELNNKRHDLIAIASPHIKLLKSPYSQLLDIKSDKDYLYVEGSIIQLQAMWDSYVANELTNTDNKEFPVTYTEQELDQHQTDIQEFQLETVSTPFAASGGWIPQDIFNTLKEQGIIVETEPGQYKLETDKMLEQDTQ
ncbi:Altered inheritance of mitochondria protein 9 mitochondrial [Spathaspora sp. JA1]|nr:Altered inheritance of mitochondria protein 9 mitochondrial [Spathaspora sp. JA1]